MGNGSSISINSIVKTHIFSNHISAFLYKNKSQGTFNNMSGYNNSYEDDELSCKTIRPSRLCYHLTNEGMINSINDILDLFNSHQMLQYNSENLYQVLLFPYLYDGHHNEKLSLMMNDKLNDILGISNIENADRYMEIEKSKTFTTNDLKSLKEKEKIKAKKTYYNFNSLLDKKMNLSFDDLNNCSEKEIDECEKIFTLSNNINTTSNFFSLSKKRMSLIEEEKNINKNSPYTRIVSSLAKTKKIKKLNLFQKGNTLQRKESALQAKTKYSDLVRNINLHMKQKQSCDIQNIPIKSGLFSFHSQLSPNIHENSLRNYFQENLSPSPNEKMNKKPHNKRSNTQYKIDLTSIPTNANTEGYILSTVNSGPTFSMGRASRLTSKSKKTRKTNVKHSSIKHSNNKFINKIDVLYGIDLHYKERIIEMKNKQITEQKKYENDTMNSNKNTIETFQNNNKDSGLEKDLDFLEDLSNNSNNFGSDNSSNHNFIGEIVSNKNLKNEVNQEKKVYNYSKYLDMPSTKQKLKMCKGQN